MCICERKLKSDGLIISRRFYSLINTLCQLPDIIYSLFLAPSDSKHVCLLLLTPRSGNEKAARYNNVINFTIFSLTELILRKFTSRSRFYILFDEAEKYKSLISMGTKHVIISERKEGYLCVEIVDEFKGRFIFKKCIKYL